MARPGCEGGRWWWSLLTSMAQFALSTRPSGAQATTWHASTVTVGVCAFPNALAAAVQSLTPTLPALVTAQATVSFSQCTFSAWDADKQVARQCAVQCDGVIALSLNPVTCMCGAPNRTALPSTPLLAIFSCKAVTSRWMATRCVSSQ